MPDARSNATYAIAPKLEKPSGHGFRLGGFVGKRIEANLRQWLLVAPRANPAMLHMFRDRKRLPGRDLLPWSGEFVGKYLISAIQGWRLTRDAELKSLIDRVVRDLISARQADGYLGPFTPELRLTSDRWDIWGHYHWMLALMMHYDDTGDDAALTACRKAGDLLCETFVGNDARILSPEQNLAILHGACELYKRTGASSYLKLAERIIEEQSKPDSCRYLEDAAAGLEIQEFRARRWEGLHCIQGILELGLLTGNGAFIDAFTHIWWAMLKGDRHNTGGFSSAEACQGNPYDLRAIETCCTIAWMALTVDMLRLTGDARVADELELSLFNGALGAQHPSGRWWTYSTPMDGDRKASAHEIVFQARPGSPELNCCSVNAPRGIGMLTEWAAMTSERGIALNYYGQGTVSAALADGTTVALTQETDYPVGGEITLTVEPDRTANFVLSLRVPQWSRNTTIRINGDALPAPTPGSYAEIERLWQPGDTVELSLDLTPHFWVGERDVEGKSSVYRGPILLTYDRYFNDMDPHDVPELDARNLALEPVRWEGWVEPLTLWRTRGADERDVLLCDFASAGATGTPYRSWLAIGGLSSGAFSRDNPLRMTRPRD
ncbi:MAG: glycoside hydrolase family 127 protein [Candidatus Poribacteria bacterium]|nr:glycoside hydrolase family 127 protein [Candidatus Poribacteria bacterium]